MAREHVSSGFSLFYNPNMGAPPSWSHHTLIISLKPTINTKSIRIWGFKVPTQTFGWNNLCVGDEWQSQDEIWAHFSCKFLVIFRIIISFNYSFSSRFYSFVILVCLSLLLVPLYCFFYKIEYVGLFIFVNYSFNHFSLIMLNQNKKLWNKRFLSQNWVSNNARESCLWERCHVVWVWVMCFQLPMILIWMWLQTHCLL